MHLASCSRSRLLEFAATENKLNPSISHMKCDRVAEKMLEDMSSAEIKYELKFRVSAFHLSAKALNMPEHLLQ